MRYDAGRNLLILLVILFGAYFFKEIMTIIDNECKRRDIKKFLIKYKISPIDPNLEDKEYIKQFNKLKREILKTIK